MINEIKKLIFLSLGADLVASLLFIFSLQLKLFAVIICFYSIALLLVISSTLACFHNYKRNKFKILLFIIFINIVLLILYTAVIISII